MLPEEAVTFLFSRTGRDDDNAEEREAAANIAQELGYLPLALEQAGAYVNAKKAQFQQYLASYRKRRLELLQEARPVTGEYPESVATTWALNFREIEETSIAASDLLRASAFLSPDRIPLELISKGKAELGPALSKALADVNDDPLALNEVLEPLTGYSFIRLDADSQTYNIHRLVQEVVQDRIDTETQRLWAERVVRALSRAFPRVEFSAWPSCERLLPHTKAAANLIDQWNLEFYEAGRFLNQVGFYAQDRGQYSQAERSYQRSLAIFRKVLDFDDPNVATGLNNLAELYRVQGKYAEAELLHKQSLAIREKVGGQEHPSVASSLNNLAALYYAQRRYAEAEPLFKQSLAIRERVLEPESLDVATSLNNLAELYRVQRNYTEAEPRYLQSLSILEKALGPEHPNVAASLNNLAALYQDQGRYRDAETYLLRSLTINQKVLDHDHPDLAFGLNNLAHLYFLQKKYTEAEPLFNRALNISERALGPNHPLVAATLMNLAILLNAMQRGSEAEELAARAAAIRAKHSQ